MAKPGPKLAGPEGKSAVKAVQRFSARHPRAKAAVGAGLLGTALLNTAGDVINLKTQADNARVKKKDELTARQEDAKKAWQAARLSLGANALGLTGTGVGLAAAIAAKRNPAAEKVLTRTRNVAAGTAGLGFAGSGYINYARAKKAAERAGVV